MLLFIDFWAIKSRKRHSVSIHLMLLFIALPPFRCREAIPVSIHLMLLFIGNTPKDTINLKSFNTSHVTLYLPGLQTKNGYYPCFNTSHVTLYLSCSTIRSFFSLSFNTSHVTLYLTDVHEKSIRMDVSIHLMLLFILRQGGLFMDYKKFQYISCYSLSHISFCRISLSNSFNTSHVTLYRSCLERQRGSQ